MTIDSKGFELMKGSMTPQSKSTCLITIPMNRNRYGGSIGCDFSIFTARSTLPWSRGWSNVIRDNRSGHMHKWTIHTSVCASTFRTKLVCVALLNVLRKYNQLEFKDDWIVSVRWILVVLHGPVYFIYTAQSLRKQLHSTVEFVRDFPRWFSSLNWTSFFLDG